MLHRNGYLTHRNKVPWKLALDRVTNPQIYEKWEKSGEKIFLNG